MNKGNSMSDNIHEIEARLQFDTLIQAQMDEREKMRKHYSRIIAALLVTIFLIIASVAGTAIYVVANYEFGDFPSLTQDCDTSVGNNVIVDGIHFNE